MEAVLPPRYQRNYKSISVEDQGKLACSTVAIVGCGGLGGSVAEAVKIIVGREVSLRHAWLQVDLLEMEFERFDLS